MRYAELSGDKVRFVLQPDMADEYQVLPPESIEIALDADVREGDLWDGVKFTRP